jgi:hypothetical protein
VGKEEENVRRQAIQPFSTQKNELCSCNQILKFKVPTRIIIPVYKIHKYYVLIKKQADKIIATLNFLLGSFSEAFLDLIIMSPIDVSKAIM